ncbi:MAG: YbaB/EbfC family nucleoid-associated protein [Actinomycetes bacterium]|jgi:DNA-binding YbaB/EbfC family protein
MTEGMPDMSALLAQAQQMQAQLEAAQQQLDAERVTGDAGGGLVSATVTGTGELVGLVIDPQALDADDTETLADLILAAYRDASSQALDRQQSAMGPFAQGLGGPPGM